MIDRFEDRLVIHSEGGLEKGAARKSNQADPVLRERADDIGGGELRAFQPIRAEIAGEHASRGIDRDDEVSRLGLGIDLIKSKLRAGQGRESKCERCGLEQEYCPPLGLSPTTDQLLHQSGGDQADQVSSSPHMRPDAKPKQGHED